MNPDALKQLFDAQAFLIMTVWGILCIKLPALRAIPNKTIPYVNVLLFVLSKFATGAAHAACKGCPPAAVEHPVGLVSLVGFGALAALIQALGWDKFLRPVVERLSAPKA